MPGPKWEIGRWPLILVNSRRVFTARSDLTNVTVNWLTGLLLVNESGDGVSFSRPSSWVFCDRGRTTTNHTDTWCGYNPKTLLCQFSSSKIANIENSLC